jgi:hypothetical protein
VCVQTGSRVVAFDEGLAPLLHMDLVSRSGDTLRTGCGSGSKDVALSSTSQLAWTGPVPGLSGHRLGPNLHTPRHPPSLRVRPR